MISPSQPVTPKKLKNISGHDLSSNQELVPVPYFAGVAKLSLTWITPKYDQHSVSSGGGGKKGAGAQSTQEKWYADIAGVAAICPNAAPVDHLLYLLVNDEIAFTGPMSREQDPGHHFSALTLETYCQQARCFFGTDDSPTDNLVLYPRQSVIPEGVDPRVISTWPALDAEGNPWEGDDPPPGVPNPFAGHYDFHPAYLNNFYFVFRRFFLGASPNMPTVSVVAARGCKFFDGTRLETTVAGVNPMGPLYELLTDDLFGCGMPEEFLHKPSFLETADKLTAAGIYVSPVIRDAKSARAFCADYLQNFDGFLCRDGHLLKAGYFDHGDIDQEGLLELDSDHIAGGEPSITPGTIEDVKTHFDLEFTNRLKWFGDDTESFVRLDVLEALDGERRPHRQSRRDIIDPQLAQRFVTETAFILGSVGGGSGQNGFLWDSVRDLLPGDRFKLLSTSFGLEMLMRCLTKDSPAAGESIAKLSYIIEQADWDHLYIQPPAPKDEDFTIEAAEIENARVVELPSPLKHGNGLEVAILAERPSPPIIGFRTHVSADDVTYDRLNTQTHFAVRAKIVEENYPADTDLVDDTVGLLLELFGVDLASIESLSDQQRDDMTGLIWFGNEIGSWGTVTAEGAGQYRVFLRRGCYGTAQAAHAIGTEVWFVFRNQLHPIAHASFLPEATVHFKLQTFTATQNIDIADVDPIDHTFGDGPFLLNDLELFGQGADRIFTGRNPRFRVNLYDISGLGIVPLPGQAPAAFNEETGLWHDLVATGLGEDILAPAVHTVGSPTEPITGAPFVFNAETDLWYAIVATGTGEDIIPALDTASGTATPPAGGTPILFNPENNQYYRLFATGTGDDILLQIDTAEALTPGSANLLALSDAFVRLDWRVRDPDTGDTLWTSQTEVPERIFGYEENALSLGGPRRRFLMGVSAVARLDDGSLFSTPWLEHEFQNPQSTELGGSVTAGYDRLDFFLNPSTDLDWSGLALWRSQDPEFEVADEEGNLTEGVELVHDGPENFFSVPQPEGTTWYYISASYDVFSPVDHASPEFFADLLFSAVVPFTTLSFVPEIPPPAISHGTQTFESPLAITVDPPAGMTVRYNFAGEVQPNSQEWPGGLGSYTALAVAQSCVLHWRGYDAAGVPTQQGTAVFTLVGAGAGGGGTCGTVEIRISGTPHFGPCSATLICAEPSSTIKYSKNGGVELTYSTPVVLALDNYIEAHGEAPGLADSPSSYFQNDDRTV